MKNLISIIFLMNLLYSDSLNSLLQEYEDTSNNSLQTVNEKLGHVLVYSQKELNLMQYETLDDVLKELPLINLNRNRYGFSTPSIAGTKTTVSGFFRLFLNDHEVSSTYTQSFSLSWGNMPLDLVDYIEIYYGESSFSLGNETGVYFIRVYTKKAIKENATQLKTVFSNNNSFSQGLMHSEIFENGWAYLLYLNKSKHNNEQRYKNHTLNNDMNRRYFYLDLNNDTTKINVGYSDLEKDTYTGLSLDLISNDGELNSKDYFIDVSKKLSYDRSWIVGGSYSVNRRQYEEKNDEGLFVIPIIDWTQNPLNTAPKEFKEDLRFTKSTGYVTKKFHYKNNQLLSSLHIKEKTYEVLDRKSVNFSNEEMINTKFNEFSKETIYSFIVEDNYKINDKVVLVGNIKFDKYNRDDHLSDSNEKMHKVGVIYTPYKNFGFKAFYTKTYLPPSFYTADAASYRNKNVKTQKYKFFTAESVLTTEKSKVSLTYHNVKINDFIYFTPIGFENIDHQIQTEGLIFDYKYDFSNNTHFAFNYYITDSSETINNANNGGYLKFMSSVSKIEYFASLIYKNSYDYKPSDSNNVSVDNSYNLNMGVTYNYSKDVSISIKGENLLDKSTQSLYSDSSPTVNYGFNDFERTVSLSVKWVF